MSTVKERMIKTKVLIIGSGPAGYTAAIYAARAMLYPVLISGVDTGGQLMITTDVENYPGYAQPVQGPWLMEQMRLQAEHVGAALVSDYITRVDLTKRPFLAIADSGDVYECATIIIATGAKAKWLGLSSEDTFKGYGVSACATCDGFFYKGKEVAVIGGGNSAVEEALYLANIASRVTLIHRRDTLRAERILQDRLLRHPKISIIWNCEVQDILGSENPPSVTGLRLRNIKDGHSFEYAAEGVFIAIGHYPATELFSDQISIKSNGYIQTAPDSTATNIPGVFAAGDVTDDIYRQAVTAAGMGCMAALEAERWLASLE